MIANGKSPTIPMFHQPLESRTARHARVSKRGLRSAAPRPKLKGTNTPLTTDPGAQQISRKERHMKLIFSAAIAALISTTAFAGTSDRYKDLRFDTATKTQAPDRATHLSAPLTQTVLSTRDTKRKPYAYQNPFGVGPNNDSR